MAAHCQSDAVQIQKNILAKFPPASAVIVSSLSAFVTNPLTCASAFHLTNPLSACSHFTQNSLLADDIPLHLQQQHTFRLTPFPLPLSCLHTRRLTSSACQRMDRRSGGGGDSHQLVYSSSFHHREEGRGQLLRNLHFW